MKIKAKRGHMEIIFPVVLFLVFTLTALFIILYAAKTYQNIVETSNHEYERTTSLAYLTRKVQASDNDGAIAIIGFQGQKALTLSQEIEGVNYVTLIYAYNGNLREVFCPEDSVNVISPDSGTILFPADEFIPSFNGNLLTLTISANGEEYSRFVTVRGEEELG